MFLWSECSCCKRQVLSLAKIHTLRGFTYACELLDKHYLLYHGRRHDNLIKVFDDFDDVEKFILEQMEEQMRVLRRTIYRAKKTREKEVLETVMGS